MSAYEFLHDAGDYERQLYQDELVIDFYDLYDYNSEYAMLLLNEPDQILGELYSIYDPSKEKRIYITNLIETTKLRDISSEHHGKLIQITGVVTSVSIPVSRLKEATFICPECGEENVVLQDNCKLIQPSKCVANGCNNRRFRETDLSLEKSTYHNFQTMTLQEDQNELPSGEIPEPIEIHLYGDLVRDVVGGNHVSVVGVVTLKETKKGSLNYTRVLEANSIIVMNDSPEDVELTESEVETILETSKKPNLEKLLINSYAPSIYGWEHVKQALLYLQFGGVRKEKGNNYVRGDINILLAGDPATAKTQFLIFTQKLAMRGEMSTAGASLVGLTAALTKEDDRFVVSPGTMALADNGVHCVDEADKLGDLELGKVHQAMEQQFIKVDKGGLHMILNARCANLFACNPTEGRWNVDKTLPQNVKNFPDSFLTRFDLAFIMVDRSDEDFDTAMANRILGLDDGEAEEIIDFDLLRKYIIYAKRLNPVLTKEAKERIRDFFIEKRQQKKNDSEGTRITPRQLEAFPRLMQARARLHLRSEATVEDFDEVLKLFNIYINEVYRDPATGQIDFDIAHDIPTSKRNMIKRTPMLFDLMVENGLGHTLDGGDSYVVREEFEKYMVRSWSIDIIQAREVMKSALVSDYLCNPFLNRITKGME